MRIALLLFACVSALHGAVESADLTDARSLLAAGKVSEAQAKIEQVLQSEPAAAEAHFLLGKIYLERHHADPRKRAHYAYDRQDTKRAIAALEQAIALAPQNSEYHRVLAEAHHRYSKEVGIFSRLAETKKAHRLHERAVELAPDDIDARWSLMLFYHQAPPPVGGGVDRAFAQAEEIKRRHPQWGGLALARLHSLDGKPARALAELEASLARFPDDYRTAYQFGRIAAASGLQLDRGLAALRACLKQTPPAGAPDHADVQARIGDILRRKGDREGARVAYIAALTQDPQHRDATAGLARLN